ncbi:MAG: D-glucuronyl C5-epimerase family protein [Candidatus Zixiibacteriota bacterium]
MHNLRRSISNLLQYVGVESRDYYHAVPTVIHDRTDPLAYYVDFRSRAAYPGPFDPSGLPLTPIPNGAVVFPTHLAMYALGHLELYHRAKTEESLSRARICAEWLAANQQADGSWMVTIPKKEFGLTVPFRSAMVQGLGMSVLCRVGAVLGESRYLDSAVRALEPLGRDTADDGVTTYHDAGPFYEEYPCRPACHVLNGFVYALWGLHDLAQQNSSYAQQLWDAGVKTLAAWLPRYDIGYWSLYHLPETPRNPATVPYHRLHINQLAAMHLLTSEPVFKKYEDRWRGYLSSRMNALRTLPAKLRWRMAIF